jgi:hypothetical protein
MGISKLREPSENEPKWAREGQTGRIAGRVFLAALVAISAEVVKLEDI